MGSISQPKNWLITGASQGLGLMMAMSALKAGHKVLAGARNPSKAAAEHPELEAAGGKWFQLDVTLPETRDVVSKAVEEAGGVDVLVNNAGISVTALVEDITYVQLHAHENGNDTDAPLGKKRCSRAMSTNFFGHIRVLKGALPAMRAQKAGTIIMNSSILGLYPTMTGTLYNGPKAAADMLHEILQIELAAFNIRVVTLNVGLFKTKIVEHSQQPSVGFTQDYLELPTLGALASLQGGWLEDPDKNMPGDPVKFGDRVVDIVDRTGYGAALTKTQHVFMGRDGLDLAQRKLDWLKADLESSQRIGLSTDMDGTAGLGMTAVADMQS